MPLAWDKTFYSTLIEFTYFKEIATTADIKCDKRETVGMKKYDDN